MNIQIFNQQNTLSINTTNAQNIVREVLRATKTKYDEVSVYFVEEDEICKLHDTYFNDPSPTDCISFPMDSEEDSGYLILGDIFINPKAAIDYVQINTGDVYEELTLYIIHGLLHLLGHDDIDEEDAKKMRKEEKIQLDHLKAHSVYLQT